SPWKETGGGDDHAVARTMATTEKDDGEGRRRRTAGWEERPTGIRTGARKPNGHEGTAPARRRSLQGRRRAATGEAARRRVMRRSAGGSGARSVVGHGGKPTTQE